jgi:hypothetical membrane protein
MELKYHTYSLSSLTGLIAVVVFSVFTFISLALYPVPYNPLYDWVSNLGNINLNPVGSYFFNGGCIITGLFLIVFFAGLFTWNPNKTLSRILLILGMVVGIIASISLIMVGVYPETDIQQHLIAAASVFILLFIVIILLNLSLFNNPKFIRGVAYLGFLVIIIDISFQYLLSVYRNISINLTPTLPVPGLEWAAVLTSLAWVGILALNMMIKRI